MRLISACLINIALLCGRSLGASEGPSRPNILFAIADDWGRDAGAYGTRLGPHAGLRPRRARGAAVQPRLHPERQVRAVARHPPHRPTLVAARGGGQPHGLLPRQIPGLPEALAGSGYFVGTTGKGWGPGVANDADGKPRAICGKPFENARPRRPPRPSRTTITPPTSPTSSTPRPGTAVVLLVRGHRTPSRLRGRAPA